MKKETVLLWIIGMLIASVLYLTGCSSDDPSPSLTGESVEYPLHAVSNPAIMGVVTFAKRNDNATIITIQLSGTQAGTSHPSHIHANTAAETGAIVVDLTSVDGTTGKSETVVKLKKDGVPVSYEELIEFDGYVNVHASQANLATLIAQGDIGQNVLTGEFEEYELKPLTAHNHGGRIKHDEVSGVVRFEERANGETLATIDLEGTTAGNSHPAHIHFNTAAQTGGIAVDFNNVDGATGISKTNISALKSGTAITYSELIEFNGYVNVHNSAADLGTLIVQGDIGQNALTGNMQEYILHPVSNPSISGTLTLEERRNGQTLATLILQGTTEGGNHPAHIHNNTALQTGGIAIDFTNVNGTTGISRTNISALRNGTPITYAELIVFNGYANVHNSSTDLGTLIAQGDIGQNALTGRTKIYQLGTESDPAISGTVMFAERNNGKTLVTLSLTGTTAGGDHPAHIHANNSTVGGSIVVDLTNVNGTTGKSMTNVTMFKDGSPVSYETLIGYNGHVNVHLSPTSLATLIAQGNIGSNVP